jgi:hypothetical protein
MNAKTLLLVSLVASAAPAALAHSPAGTPKNYCEDPSEWNTHDYLPVANGKLFFYSQDGNFGGDCNGDGVPADFDFHLDYAFGGALLTVADVPACNTEFAHHPRYGPFSVIDNVFGSGQAFWVTADLFSVLSGNPCGDFESDVTEGCVGTCSVTFPPSLDGTYRIFVGYSAGGPGTSGHVCSPWC